ncbi:MAG: metal-dependent hydrolase [Candidatus Hodarchaeales archaeon]
MTLSPTHLSLESILLWIFLPESEKQDYKLHKYLFWTVILFSILPDLDFFFGIHRGISHSLVIPLVITIVGTLMHYNYHYLKHSNSSATNNETIRIRGSVLKKEFIGRSIFYSGLLWILHIVLDLEYPLAIFYPFSDRLYQINFEILIDMSPWLFLPVTIAGIGFKITSISYLKGLSSYFVNLPPSTRYEIFGTKPVSFSISDFFVHLLLFVIFLAFIAKPMAPSLQTNKFKSLKHFYHEISSIKLDAPLLAMSLILILTGFISGPVTGFNSVEDNSLTGSFQVSSNVFAPTIALTFEPTNYLLQPFTHYKIESSLITQSDDNPFDQVLLITEKVEYNSFVSSVSTLYKEFPFNSSNNIDNFSTQYNNLLLQLYSSALAMNLTNLNEIHLSSELQSGSYAVIGVIENWNGSAVLESQSFFEQALLQVKIISSRISLYSIGVILLICGIILLTYSIKIKR